MQKYMLRAFTSEILVFLRASGAKEHIEVRHIRPQRAFGPLVEHHRQGSEALVASLSQARWEAALPQSIGRYTHPHRKRRPRYSPV